MILFVIIIFRPWQPIRSFKCLHFRTDRKGTLLNVMMLMFSNCVTKMSKNVRQTASHQHPAPAEPLEERWGSGVTGSPKALPLEHMEEHSVPSTVWHLMEHQYQRANTTRTEENICFPTQSGSAP